MPKQNTQIPHQKVDMKKALLRLAKYLKPYFPIIIISLVLFVANTVFVIIGPDQISKITDILQQALPIFNKNGEMISLGVDFAMSQIWDIAKVLIILYVLGAIFTYIANILIARACFKVSQKLRSEISGKIDRLPLKKLDRTPYGNVLSIVSNDVDLVGDTLLNCLPTLVSCVVQFVGSLLMMFLTNWIMAFAALASTALGFVIITFIMKKSQKYFVEGQNRLGELNGVIEESYSGQTVIKTYNAKDEFKNKFEKANKKLYQSAWKGQFVSGTMHPIMGFVGNLGYVVVCIIGAMLFIEGKIASFGVITAFMIYIRLFTRPLTQIAQAMTSLQQSAAASERVFNFLEEEEISNESNKKVKLPKIRGNIEIKNIKFGYDEDREIIHGFSASIKAGQKVAIVGPTGAGKTTIVNLLMRFYEVNSGDILIDGVSIKKMTRTQVRDIFSMVLQDTWLFEGTIRENLIYNKEGITEDDLNRVCKSCGLDHFIKTLPEGFDTVLSDETNVSVGQKQLLTIARAMLQNSPMLILDEATSNVDTRTEELIQKAMDKLTENRTSFVIAHRLSTIKNADMILVLKEGDIIETGSHKELIKNKGFYADLYNSQFSLEGADVIE